MNFLKYNLGGNGIFTVQICYIFLFNILFYYKYMTPTCLSIEIDTN